MRRNRLGQMDDRKKRTGILIFGLAAIGLIVFWGRRASAARKTTTLETVPYTIQRGDYWSAIAANQFGDFRFWPLLWDLNRGNAALQNPDVIPVGVTVALPLSIPEDPAFRAALFARAEAHRAYLLNPVGSMPAIVYQSTPLP